MRFKARDARRPRKRTKIWPVLILGGVIAIAAASPRLLDLLWGNAPILFYGEIVDDSGRPVANAKVTMHVVAEKRLQIPALFAGNQTGWMIRTDTDQNGKFVVHGGWGTELQMIDVQKTGFGEASPVGHNGIFDYSSRIGALSLYRPDPANPAVFRLHPKPRSR